MAGDQAGRDGVDQPIGTSVGHLVSVLWLGAAATVVHLPHQRSTDVVRDRVPAHITPGRVERGRAAA